MLRASRAVAFLEFLVAAAWARIVATNVLQGIAHRLLVSVAAVRAVDMAMLVIVMVMIVVAIRAVHVGLVAHGVTPESNRRELCRHRGQYARCHQIKIRS